jgi:hypothetical protein
MGMVVPPEVGVDGGYGAPVASNLGDFGNVGCQIAARITQDTPL